MSTGRVAKRYNELSANRSSYLDRAYTSSSLTLPSLITEVDVTNQSGVDFKSPFQSVGAAGVNSLAAKLLLALLPPNMPFFRLRIDSLKLPELEQDRELRTDFDEALSKIEQLVMGDVASSTDRTVLFEALKHLIISGNILMYCPLDNKSKMRSYSLKKYVVNRDPEGSVLEIIVKEDAALSALPDATQQQIKGMAPNSSDKSSDVQSISVYTYIKRESLRYRVHQEAKGIEIEGTHGTYPLHACPWLPIRFIRADGESYGRSLVEEYIGDLTSLEALSQTILEGVAASAKLVFLVDPNGMTSEKDLAETPNGGFASGRAGDVSCLQASKQADINLAVAAAEKLEKRLGYAFMLNASIQRRGERVTAEEIRIMAEDLETSLGGVYSLLSEEFQLPYVNCKLVKLQKTGKMKSIPRDVVKPSIVTGMDALGRASDKAKLTEFMGLAAQTFGADVIAQFINPLNGLTRLAASLGLDKTGLVKEEEEVAAAAQEAQGMQMMGQLGPAGINAFKEMMLKGGMDGG